MKQDVLFCFSQLSKEFRSTLSQCYLKGVDVSLSYLYTIKVPSHSKGAAKGHLRPLKEASLAFAFQAVFQNS